jgi:ABC-type nitrate/sulfonate/bicarbonate transport system substrate-binding protein
LPLRIAKATLLVALFCLALAGNAAAQAPQPPQLRYGESPSTLRSIFSLPILVAERQGFFAREGLNFGIVVIDGGEDKTIQALHDGTADVSHVATNFLVDASLRGSDAVAIAAEFNNPIYSLVAKPHIKSFDDLKGKMLGLAVEAGTITIATRKLLTMHGVREGDFRFKIIEGTPTRFACLTKGDCDAVPLGQPHDIFALRQGYRLLGLSTEAVPDFLYTVTVARKSWADANKDTVLRYVRGLASAFKYIRDPANRADIVKTIEDAFGSTEGSAQQTLSLYFEPERNVLPYQAEINMQGLAQVIAIMGEAGTLKAPLPAAERFVDLQYLRAAGLQ